MHPAFLPSLFDPSDRGNPWSARQSDLSIGYSNLGLKPEKLRLPENELAGWIEALNRNMIDRQKDYGNAMMEVALIGIVSHTRKLAGKYPAGDYDVRVLHIRDNWWQKTAPLFRWPSARCWGRLFIRLLRRYSSFLRAVCDCLCSVAGWVAAAGIQKKLKKQRWPFLSAENLQWYYITA